MSLATLDAKVESVDFFLTKPNEPLSHFLQLNTTLKLCYASLAEIKADSVKHVPSI